MRKQEEFQKDPLIIEACKRGIIEISGDKINYNLYQKKVYAWNDPEEWVRAYDISLLVLKMGYIPQRIRTEVIVPRRTPSVFADIVVYRDDKCHDPYLVVECKKEGISEQEIRQAIEQLFGNANSSRIPFALFDCFSDSRFYDVASYPPTERALNLKGNRDIVPESYGIVPSYTYVAGPGHNDIKPATAKQLESKVKRAHSIIWAGGKRDPLLAFDEWSKLMMAKVEDERNTPNGKPRKFQVGSNESYVAVASRIHDLFSQACASDRTIFPVGININLSDKKIVDVVRVLQDICITDTTVDNIGAAFEIFFGSVFRGELGQYFTMRPLARFVVAMLEIARSQYVLDPTCGSGGFLLETLLQVWNSIDKDYAGRSELMRYKNDFAQLHVYGIEIHEILARICKINLLLHHDGHTNIEGDKSCLDTNFTKDRLKLVGDNFQVIVGNPPFGDNIKEGDEDQLGKNTLDAFEVARGRKQVPSEHIILERSVGLLEDDGLLGFILPDGLFNNQGEQSNCPQLRSYLIRHGIVLAIVSLPDFAFRKSGAQNKTSILFYKKYNFAERTAFENAYNNALPNKGEEFALVEGLKAIRYKLFMAEASSIGYSTTGVLIEKNDLYKGSAGGHLDDNQDGTILGEYRRFRSDTKHYSPSLKDCAAFDIVDVWRAHKSHRLDPKYHLFKIQENHILPEGWVSKKISSIMKRREEIVHPEKTPEDYVKVMTLSQTGDIRERSAGKGNNPPEWQGMYFEDSPSKWYKAHSGDVVFSSIDLWKGCISVVDNHFDGALVTKEYPIYQMKSDEILPEFLATLLRSRYYQRAFRAITTGHSNRRRTQTVDFEEIEVCFPPSKEQQRILIKEVLDAKQNQVSASDSLREAMRRFSNVIDGRGDEEEYSIDRDIELELQ